MDYVEKYAICSRLARIRHFLRHAVLTEQHQQKWKGRKLFSIWSLADTQSIAFGQSIFFQCNNNNNNNFQRQHHHHHMRKRIPISLVGSNNGSIFSKTHKFLFSSALTLLFAMIKIRRIHYVVEYDYYYYYHYLLSLWIFVFRVSVNTCTRLIFK